MQFTTGFGRKSPSALGVPNVDQNSLLTCLTIYVDTQIQYLVIDSDSMN